MSLIENAIQDPTQIEYLSGANNYTWICFRNGEKKLLAKPISYLETKLPTFIRTHKTCLVNPICVKSLAHPLRKKMAGAVHLTSGMELPVSRRRWELVVEALANSASTEPVVVSPVIETDHLSPMHGIGQERFISLVTDDVQNAEEIKRMIEAQWPLFTLHVIPQTAYLPELLNQLPERDYPAFLLLDARTSVSERLSVLQRLKTDSQLCRIPVILLVGQSDKLVTNGYRQSANSVIAVPARAPQLTHIVERICRFWLQTAALPLLAN